jgi:hypothetical protein
MAWSSKRMQKIIKQKVQKRELFNRLFAQNTNQDENNDYQTQQEKSDSTTVSSSNHTQINDLLPITIAAPTVATPASTSRVVETNSPPHTDRQAHNDWPNPSPDRTKNDSIIRSSSPSRSHSPHLASMSVSVSASRTELHHEDENMFTFSPQLLPTHSTGASLLNQSGIPSVLSLPPTNTLLTINSSLAPSSEVDSEDDTPLASREDSDGGSVSESSSTRRLVRDDITTRPNRVGASVLNGARVAHSDHISQATPSLYSSHSLDEVESNVTPIDDVSDHEEDINMDKLTILHEEEGNIDEEDEGAQQEEY